MDICAKVQIAHVLTFCCCWCWQKYYFRDGRTEGSDRCMLSITPHKHPGWVLGVSFMRSYYTGTATPYVPMRRSACHEGKRMRLD